MTNATIRIYYEDNGKPINLVYHVPTYEAIVHSELLKEHGYMMEEIPNPLKMKTKKAGIDSQDRMDCPCPRCVK